MPLNVGECLKQTKAARAKERAAIHAAISALQSALQAKQARLHAFDRLLEAKGRTPRLNQEALILNSREQRGCEALVRRALAVMWWNRFGF
jgi:hypothetical protein